MIIVHLDWNECHEAGRVGWRRRLYAMEKCINRRAAGNMDLWDIGDDVAGALAEKAYSKWSGLPWSGTIGETNHSDFPGVEIKSSKWGKKAGLILQPRNTPNAVYILATPPDTGRYDLRGQFVCFRGWIEGSVAITYPNDPKKLYVPYGEPQPHYVPLGDLHPMETYIAPHGVAA